MAELYELYIHVDYILPAVVLCSQERNVSERFSRQGS